MTRNLLFTVRLWHRWIYLCRDVSKQRSGTCPRWQCQSVGRLHGPCAQCFRSRSCIDFVGKNDRSVAKAFKSGDRILGRRPIELKSGEQFTRWDYREFVTSVLAESAYDQIEKISELVRKANGSGKKSEAKVTFERIKKPYNSNAGGIFSVVNSIDYSDRPSKMNRQIWSKVPFQKGLLVVRLH